MISFRRMSGGTLAVFFGCAILIGAASEGQRDFDIPAGPAVVTLKLFAEQSGRGVIFATDYLGDVKTNAIHGTYVVRNALDLLLARTELIAFEDTATKSFAVRRNPPPLPKENLERRGATNAPIKALTTALNTSDNKP